MFRDDVKCMMVNYNIDEEVLFLISFLFILYLYHIIYLFYLS